MSIYNSSNSGENTAGTDTSIPTYNVAVSGTTSGGACGVGITFATQIPTDITVLINGVSATEVAGTASLASSVMTKIYTRYLGSVSGNVPIAISWTGGTFAGSCAIIADGCDNTTPMYQGDQEADTGAGSATPDITTVATASELTMTMLGLDSGRLPDSPTQTSRYASNVSFQAGAACSTAPGVNPTHQWTDAGGAGSYCFSRATFKGISGTTMTATDGSYTVTGTAVTFRVGATTFLRYRK